MRDRTDEVLKSGFSEHVLVCTNARDSEYAACAGAHGEEVYGAVEAWLRERGVLWSRVHVAGTSCLGLCSADRTALAIHPRGRWYSDVVPGDVPALLRGELGAGGSRSGPGSGAREGVE